MKNVGGILLFCVTLLQPFSQAFAAGEGAQTFTVDGRLYADAAATTALTDASVTITFQILNPAQNCILYEETQPNFNAAIGNGYFTLQVGSIVGAGKRSSLDSAHPMNQVFSNLMVGLSGRTLGGAACSYSATPGDIRYIRMLVTPSSDGMTRVLSPNMALDSVPTAMVAERAENLQGLGPTNLLQVNTSGSEVLSQSNLENIFSSSNYSALTALLAGSSGLYSKPAANGTTPLANVSSPASPAAGQMWYDSGAIKFYNGSTTQTLGVSGSGITSLVAGTGLNVGSGPGGTITSTGTLNVDTGTTAGQIVQVAAGNKLPVIDGSNLTLLNGSAINSGTIGGSTAMNTTGNIAAAAVTATGNVGAATVTTTGAITATGNITGAVLTGTSVVGTTGSFGSTSTGQISLFDHPSTNTNYITLKTPATASLTSDYVLTLPDALPGSSGQVLTSDTSGKLTWTSPSSGSVTSVGGTAPITISGTGSAPVVNVSAATTTTSGVVTLAADGGTTASTVVQATDARLSDARLPSNNSDLLKVSAMPANCAAGSSLTFSSPSGSWVCTTIPDATASSKGIMQVGTGLSVTTGTVSLASGIATPGTYSKVTVDTYGRVTTTANIGSSDITTALGFTPLNKAGDVMTGTFGLNPVSTATETTLVTGFGASDKGKMWFNTDLKKIHMWDGSAIVSVTSPAVPTSSQNGQSLRWNDTSKAWEYFTAGVSGSGIGTFNTLTGNTQTLANGSAGTAPGWVSSGSTHTLNIPMASTSSVTAGLISKTDYDNFNGKISDSYTLAGDVTGTPAATSVDRIKGKAVTTPTASGQMLVYDGTGITPVAMSSDATMAATGAVTLKNTGTAGTYYKVTTDAKGRVSSGVTTLTSADLTDAGDLLKASNMPATCSADKTLTFSSPTGTWVCSSIAGLDAGVITTGTIAAARLPASVQYWTAATGGINYAGGNVGIGTASPSSTLHVYDTTGYPTVQFGTWSFLGTGASGYPYFGFGTKFNKTTTQWDTNHTTVPGMIMRFHSGGTNFEYFPTNTTNATATTAMGISSSTGNVGIGTASPAAKLDVIGGIAVQMATSTAPNGIGYGPSTQNYDYTNSFGTYKLNHYGMTIAPLSGSAATYLSGHGEVGLFTGGQNRLLINSSGNVGIGTTSPTVPLHVKAPVLPGAHSNRIVQEFTDFYNGGVNGQNLAISTLTSGTNYGGWNLSSDWGGRLSFGVTTGANVGTSPNEYLSIIGGGNVGIGTTAPTHKFHVYGDARINSIQGGETNSAGNFHLDARGTGATYINYFGGTSGLYIMNGATGYGAAYAASFNVNSDERLKKNIEPIENGLEIIDQLRGVRFDWINRKESPDRQVGVIAQDVQKVLPELVSTNRETKKLAVNYSGLVSPLIAAVKELYHKWMDDHVRINELEKENALLKAEDLSKGQRLEHLESRLRQLEQRMDRVDRLPASK